MFLPGIIEDDNVWEKLNDEQNSFQSKTKKKNNDDKNP
jgi:hypothetical protein